jgi:nucleotide-binding universal stress UspA family protein
MLQSILVPLDGSTFGEQALPLAVSVARRAGAALRLLHVEPPVGSIYEEPPLLAEHPSLEARMRHRRRHSGQSYLKGLLQRFPEPRPAPATCVVTEGEVAQTIRDQAALAGADLLVITTHGRGPLGRLWLGSVADELVRSLSVPILLVRPTDAGPDFVTEPVFKHLLVPLDGTALAEQMLEPAADLGSLMGAGLTLMRVIKPVGPAGFLPDGDTLGEQTRELIERTQREENRLWDEAGNYLEAVAERLRGRSLRVRTRVAVEPHPAVALLEEARRQRTDLIALATHGRRGLSRMLLGSVADKVVRGSSLPVLVRCPSAPPVGKD